MTETPVSISTPFLTSPLSSPLSSPRSIDEIKDHPFWNAPIGSELLFRIREGDANMVRGLNVKVYTMTPRSFQVQFLTFEGQSPIVCDRKEATRIIKDEWLYYYSEQTDMEYIQHILVDMSLFFTKSTIVNESSNTHHRKLSLQLNEITTEGDVVRGSGVSGGSKSDEGRMKRLSMMFQRNSKTKSPSPSSPRKGASLRLNRFSKESSLHSPTHSPTHSPRLTRKSLSAHTSPRNENDFDKLMLCTTQRLRRSVK